MEVEPTGRVPPLGEQGVYCSGECRRGSCCTLQYTAAARQLQSGPDIGHARSNKLMCITVFLNLSVSQMFILIDNQEEAGQADTKI